MGRTGSLVSAVVMAASLSLSTEARAQSADDAAAVRAVIDRLFDAMRVADTATMNALFVDNVVLLSVQQRDGNTIVSPTPMDAFLQNVGGARAQDPNVVLDERIGRTTIEIDGDLASAWTEYEFW